MAFDGFTVCGIVQELNQHLIGGRLSKIMQPETDELLFTVKTPAGAFFLTLSASASLPLVCISKTAPAKENPAAAPNFCMLLRKHIGNGKITAVSQPGLERIIDIEIEHFNELGDLECKHLIAELMGKHSNIIFCDDNGLIIDSIKHIPASVSSVREVLPGRSYFIPETVHKYNPYTLDETVLIQEILTGSNDVAKTIYTSITGFSPFLAEELVYSSGLDSSVRADDLGDTERQHLAHQIMRLLERLYERQFAPAIIYRHGEPVDYAVFPVTHIPDSESVSYESVSELLRVFYSEKDSLTRIRQKSADLRRIVQTNLERAVKKCDLQQKQLRDTEKRGRYRLYGDLLSAYGYSVEAGQTQCVLPNFYDDNKEITVPLDDTLTPLENAKKYYERYAKLRRTKEALDIQLAQTQAEVAYLSSVRTMLELTDDVQNLNELKQELTETGYIKKAAPANGRKKPGGARQNSRPYHYLSSDGYHMYVGKNNLQNDELSFRFASGNDLWFHAKGVPGSHVIVKLPAGVTVDSDTIPNRVYEEAGALAAYYSSCQSAPKVEIDYVERRHLKKPPKAQPGYVIYHTNYSLMAVPDIRMLREYQEE